MHNLQHRCSGLSRIPSLPPASERNHSRNPLPPPQHLRRQSHPRLHTLKASCLGSPCLQVLLGRPCCAVGTPSCWRATRPFCTFARAMSDSVCLDFHIGQHAFGAFCNLLILILDVPNVCFWHLFAMRDQPELGGRVVLVDLLW